MNKLKQIIGAAALSVAIAFTSTASAEHSKPLVEGQNTIMGPISACKTEETAVSIIEKLITNGFSSSLGLFSFYVTTGDCFTTSGPVEFTPIQLVTEFGDAIVVEILSSTGYTIYLVSPNLTYLEADEKPLPGQGV